ncbi:MAG: hypothetical protein COB24_14835 [Hyphomicrobiales bacterium]|nr:MAG: hypothetical protein COB24_14835 [Hyphomicrobiales bacterium]
MTIRKLKFLIISDENDSLALIEQTLINDEYQDVVYSQNINDIIAEVELIKPEILIVKLGNPTPQIMESIFDVAKSNHLPIAVFVDEADFVLTNKAMDAGVHSFVIDGFKPSRIKAIGELTLSRFLKYHQLIDQRNKAVGELCNRKIVDRAKGILMSNQDVSEKVAYNLIRSTSMKQNKKMVEIANTIILMFEKTMEF